MMFAGTLVCSKMFAEAQCPKAESTEITSPKVLSLLTYSPSPSLYPPSHQVEKIFTARQGDRPHGTRAWLSLLVLLPIVGPTSYDCLSRSGPKRYSCTSDGLAFGFVIYPTCTCSFVFSLAPLSDVNPH